MRTCFTGEVHSLDRVRQLLHPRRLAVAGALAGGPGTTADLSQRTGLSERDVLDALGDLLRGELVAADRGVYRLDEEALRHVAASLADTPRRMDPVIGFGMTDEERVILSRFFEGRTLTELPSNRAKRLVVLERLALEFDLGKRYPEAEVNEILGAFHPDWSTLRRQLVDEGFLDRAQGGRGNVYWRSGGRVPGIT